MGHHRWVLRSHCPSRPSTCKISTTPPRSPSCCSEHALFVDACMAHHFSACTCESRLLLVGLVGQRATTEIVFCVLTYGRRRGAEPLDGLVPASITARSVSSMVADSCSYSDSRASRRTTTCSYNGARCAVGGRYWRLRGVPHRWRGEGN